MTEKNYGTTEVVKEAVLRNIRRIYHDLERLTIKLDISLPSIEAGKMQEYQEALNAIERYELVVHGKIDLLTKQLAEQEN